MDDTTVAGARVAGAQPDHPGVAESIADLSARAVAYASALKELVVSEALLAKINLARLLIGALFLPALALGLVVAVDALLAALLFELSGHWLSALGTVVLCDLVALFALFWAVRKWWRSLSLPRSRAAITTLWSSHDDTQTNRERSAALGTG